MRIFVNSRERVTAIHGRCVYELNVKRKDAFSIVETWLRGTHKPNPNDPIGDESRSRAAEAIEALILCNCTIGNYEELRSKGDDRLKMFNQNVNPTGIASIDWHLCR